MKERTKETLRDGFGSLINNAAAIRGAKNGPLWLTIIFFVLSLLLPVLPIFVSQINIKGSSFVNTYSYGLEKYVPVLATRLKDNKVEMSINDEHHLAIKEDGKEIAYTSYGSEKAYTSYVNEVTKQYDFVVYVADAPTNKEKKTINTAIAAKKYTLGGTTASEEKEGTYTPSYMVLYRDGIYVVIYAANSTKPIVSSYLGDFKTMKATDTGLATLLKVTDKDGKDIAQDLYNATYTDGVFKNFKNVLNKSYETLKVGNTWGTSGIYLGIFAGLSIIMGFLMWILTRGKNNPNNYYTPWLTMKIAARLGLSPAIITLIVGFFLTQQAPLIFILTLGLRVMWVSMKELRPIQQ